jgi:hypothetical protein
MINHPPRIPLGAMVSHPLDQVCWLCQTTCAECGHSVEDGAHTAGCDECACPLHLRDDDDDS